MAQMQQEAEQEYSKLHTPWKWTIWKCIWDLLEEKDLVQSAHPVHHCIPNFIGTKQAAACLAMHVPKFVQATIIKVNLDMP